MTITLELKPETQQALSRQASASGLDLIVYATGILENAARLSPTNRAMLDLALEELAQFSHKIPLVSDEAFSRESLYPVRD